MRCARAASCRDRYTEIYVADTLGELGLIYRIAPIVFIGGSLVRHGGQNPIEAAKLGAAILHGPHVWNFAEIYSALDAAGGAELVTDTGKLDGAHRRLAEGRRGAQAGRADRACKAMDTLAGALERTVAALDPYLMQFRLERRGRTMREPAFWWRPAGLAAGLLCAAGRDLWRGRGAADGAAGRATRAFRWSASAI